MSFFAHRTAPKRVAALTSLLLTLPGNIHASNLAALDSDRIEADWRRQEALRQHTAAVTTGVTAIVRINEIIERGRRLAESQSRLGADVTKALAEFRDLELALSQPDLDPTELEGLQRRARWTVRALALANPLLDFDTILFVKRVPTLFPHMSDQHYGWWSRPGGGIHLLEQFKSASPRVRSLTAAWPAGSFAGPDLSADGRRILFAYARHYPDLASEPNKADATRVPEDAFYLLYEMNTDGTGLRRLTRGKYVLGTVPVEPDGSASFNAPSGVPVFFQALDERGLAVQTMRSLTYLMPGQSLSCVGCHEHRDTAPPVGSAPLAFRRDLSRLTPGPEGSWPLRFDQLVQPVLDQHCVRCHQPNSIDPFAATLDLTPGRAWKNLLDFGDGDLAKLAFERDRSFPGEGTAANSLLWKLLDGAEPHHGLKLDRETMERFATWMDTYAQWAGHFSDEQERELKAFRSLVADLMERP